MLLQHALVTARPTVIPLGLISVNFGISLTNRLAALKGVGFARDELREELFPCNRTGSLAFQASAVRFDGMTFGREVESYAASNDSLVGMPKALLQLIKDLASNDLLHALPLLASGDYVVGKSKAHHGVCFKMQDGVPVLDNEYCRTWEGWNAAFYHLILTPRPTLRLV